ncbi:MAG TPA: 2-amino-4-hydroxy-6-hydroxymethyldihydropteridine diphosphokinase [Alphaproteobacteria bacterium]|nr:2-amino-4-hydroxy-6-hydroxymethyldihydropteridine diphosphokinase [Alphaproteobacteria bacterium]
MILIALGANLPSTAGPPRATFEAALAELAREAVRIVRCSHWYTSAPDPPADQPYYLNGVAIVETERPPDDLLRLLHALERRYGRLRAAPNAARTLDLDLIDYHGLVRVGPPGPTLPHPRAHLRRFVLSPISEIAPGWRHPVHRKTAAELADDLPPAEVNMLIEPIEKES